MSSCGEVARAVLASRDQSPDFRCPEGGGDGRVTTLSLPSLHSSVKSGCRHPPPPLNVLTLGELSGLVSRKTREFLVRHYSVLVAGQVVVKCSDVGRRPPRQNTSQSTGFLLGICAKIPAQFCPPRLGDVARAGALECEALGYILRGRILWADRIDESDIYIYTVRVPK